MKVKVLSRNPDNYLRETKRDIQKGEFNIHFDVDFWACRFIFLKTILCYEDCNNNLISRSNQFFNLILSTISRYVLIINFFILSSFKNKLLLLT